MTEYTAQRDAIAAILAGITTVNLGRIHKHPRFGDATEHWVTTVDGVTQIRAWEIGVADPGVEEETIVSGGRERWRNWRIQGYVGLVDAEPAETYTLINDIAETISDTLANNFNLNDTALSHEAVQTSEPITVRLPLTGDNALCWAVTLTMRVLSVVT